MLFKGFSRTFSTKNNEQYGALYEKIYQDGILTYEIEEFSEDGLCRIFINRD